MLGARVLALTAKFLALLGTGLLTVAFGLAFFDPVQAPAVILAALAGAGGLCLMAFLAIDEARLT